MTKTPATIIHVGVVLRKTVRTAVMIATHNDLGVKFGDILNAHVQAPDTEKAWTTLVHSVIQITEKTKLIVNALHSSKSAGAAFRTKLARSRNPQGMILARLIQIYG